MSQSVPARPGPKPIVIYHEEVRRLSALGLTMAQIAARVGVSVRTLQSRCEQDPTLREAADQGLAEATEIYAGVLAEKIRAGDTASLIFWLKAKAGWSTVQRPAAEPAPAPERPLTFVSTADELRERQTALLAAAKREAS